MNELKAVSLNSEPGKWTRQNRTNPAEKSIIDYVLTTETIAKITNEINFDEIGANRIKGNKESDHNTIIMEINMEMKNEKKKIKKWNLNNKQGWIKYNKVLKEQYERVKPQSYEEFNDLVKKNST